MLWLATALSFCENNLVQAREKVSQKKIIKKNTLN